MFFLIKVFFRMIFTSYSFISVEASDIGFGIMAGNIAC
jgi:hypothetical protein